MITFPSFKIRRYQLMAWIALGVVALLIALAFSSWHLYDRWTARRLMLDGRAKLAAGDYQASITPLVKVWRANPKNILACRMIAEALEKIGSREAIFFREKALAVAPDNLDDAVALTNTALAFSNVSKAEAGIARIRQRRPLAPDLLPPLLARVALLRGDRAEAEAQFAEALRITPGKEELIVDLASVQAESPDRETRTAACETLQRVQAQPAFRLMAMRGLLRAAILDATSSADSFAAYSLADILVLEKNSTFEDRLLRLSLLHKTQDSFFASYRTTLQKQSLKSYQTLDQMVRWIVRENQAVECGDWLDELPQKLLTRPPLARSVAEAYLQLENWQRLVDLTTGEEWEAFDYLRLAYLAIAQAQTGRETLAHDNWQDSVVSALGNLEKLTSLLPLATGPEWSRERIDLLWKMAEVSPDPRPLLQDLLANHLEHRETASAYEACNRLLKLPAPEAGLSEKWIHLSFLLGENLPKALLQAAENVEKAPDSAEAITLLALGYLRQNRPADAYFLLRRLSSSQLEEPYAATCYGITCAWLGEREAGRHLNLGLGTPLFPEETVLQRRARRKIGQDWLPESFGGLETTAPDAFSGNYLTATFLGSR